MRDVLPKLRTASRATAKPDRTTRWSASAALLGANLVLLHTEPEPGNDRKQSFIPSVAGLGRMASCSGPMKASCSG